MVYKQKPDKGSDRNPPVKDVKSHQEREQRSGSSYEKPRANASLSVTKDQRPARCLHNGDAHWRRDCPTTSEDDRRRSLEKVRSQREGARLWTKTVRNHRRRSPTGEVPVNGMMTAPYCSDSGSDRSVIPKNLVDKLIELGSEVKLTLLPGPIVVTVAGGGHVEWAHEVVVDLQLQSAWALCMSQVSHVWSCVVTTAHSSLKWPQQTHMMAWLEIMLAAVLREGFDPSRYEELRQLVVEYRGIFALDIGIDPPARLVPLVVTLKADADPFRAKPHNYAPVQREFLRTELQYLETLGYIRKNNHSGGHGQAWVQGVSYDD
ncbi:hypothetical protein PR002_g1042 [Phytophthora rubi]|uniref:Uncharacterized protein n=1 Tax=Phytophthora rubi TaxID=129364 RepID=A0A6A3NWK8_9STRA|nr:hypothetical protein PR002_g1042 [Phytophthora rubi]